MLKIIIRELKEHIPFAIFGAFTGIIIMVILYNFPIKFSYNVFYTLHPLHVLLSAYTTAAMYKLNSNPEQKNRIWMMILVGYFGSIGIATLSDSLIPYLGEVLLNLPNRGIHIGFIEKWWLVNPLALIGIAIAYFKQTTKIPHAGHVLLSTWASLSHIFFLLLSIALMLIIILYFCLNKYLPSTSFSIYPLASPYPPNFL